MPLAEKYRLDIDVVLAVIETESGGHPWSSRKEPIYPYLVNPREWADALTSRGMYINMETETVWQMTSIGLMHVMGGVCREYNFDRLLPEVFTPQISLEYGCRHLASKAAKYGSDPATLYAAYNGGSPRKTKGGMFQNQSKVDHFYRNLRAVQAAKG